MFTRACFEILLTFPVDIWLHMVTQDHYVSSHLGLEPPMALTVHGIQCNTICSVWKSIPWTTIVNGIITDYILVVRDGIQSKMAQFKKSKNIKKHWWLNLLGYIFFEWPKADYEITRKIPKYLKPSNINNMHFGFNIFHFKTISSIAWY